MSHGPEWSVCSPGSADRPSAGAAPVRRSPCSGSCCVWSPRSDLLGPGATAAQADFPEPTEIRAVDGVLRATLIAEEQEIDLAGQSHQSPGLQRRVRRPTLRARPGERIELELVNRLTKPTNLHFHGLHVSPGGESDNIFRMVNPGETAQYVLEIPLDHPTGTFWYHPHQHHLALEQVFGGMSGVIVIDGLQEQFPPDLQGIDEHLFALKDFQLDEDGAILLENVPRDPTTRTVNGQINPSLTMAPGETQLWRLGQRRRRALLPTPPRRPRVPRRGRRWQPRLGREDRGRVGVAAGQALRRAGAGGRDRHLRLRDDHLRPGQSRLSRSPARDADDRGRCATAGVAARQRRSGPRPRLGRDRDDARHLFQRRRRRSHL